MPARVPFIGREDELRLVDKLIKEWNTLRILCIEAGGGIGKTCLLQQIREKYPDSSQDRLILADIIDFDDHTFHLEENLTSNIAKMLDETTFKPYLDGLLYYRKLEKTGINFERRKRAFSENFFNFAKCLNKIARQKRIVLFFDTTEALIEKALIKESVFVNHFVRLGKLLRNGLILIAGRNAKGLGQVLQSELGEEFVKIRELTPFNIVESENYLYQKEKLMYVDLEPELAQKLIFLARGKPILIDLAVEWRNRGISLDWLAEEKIEEIASLLDNETAARCREFERHLVKHIIQTREPIDWLLLLMSHVSPLNDEMIAAFLDMTEKEAENLFQEARTYVFVKNLPDGRITIHDEMRRMINEYVWPVVDPQKDRRRRYSEQATIYRDNRIQNLTDRIAQLKQTEKMFEKETEPEREAHLFAQIDILEKEIWVLKRQYLHHMLLVDLDKGIATFANTFDEATKTYNLSLCGILLLQIQQQMPRYSQELSIEQWYAIDNRKVKYLSAIGKYQQAKELITAILDTIGLPPEYQIDMLVSRGNIEIRLGHVTNSITDFEKAVNISKSHNLTTRLINALNFFGYAHRLIGNFDRALQHYNEAQQLCGQEGRIKEEELKDLYGWISNNLVFVLSINSNTRQTAIDLACSTVEHWQSIGNNIGLGAGYIVLGISYYRNASPERALEAFGKALDIFKPMELDDWLGQIYSWRGALYQTMGKTDIALIDLKEALNIGSLNFQAMTLNRLGRVYISQKKWDLAEEYLKQSLEHAQQIPDYVYWLVSIAKLAVMAAQKQEYHRFEEFSRMLRHYLDKVTTPQNHPLGLVYIGLAKLLFGQNDPSKAEVIIELLRQGIPLLTEAGSYGRTDILSQLSLLEEDFNLISPEIIRTVGKALQTYISLKEIENVAYRTVAPMIHKWAKWQ